MEKLFVIAALLFSTYVFGNNKKGVLAKYKATVRMGNLITRWYYDVVGTSLLFKEELILFKDNTYFYTYHGGECATFDTKLSGNWRISNDTLFLKDSLAYLNRFYVIKDNKLHESGYERTKNKWVLKSNK